MCPYILCNNVLFPLPAHIQCHLLTFLCNSAITCIHFIVVAGKQPTNMWLVRIKLTQPTHHHPRTRSYQKLDLNYRKLASVEETFKIAKSSSVGEQSMILLLYH